MKHHFTHSYSTECQNNLPVLINNLDHLDELVFVEFLHHEVFFFSLSYCALWRDVIMCYPHGRGEELCSAFLSIGYLHTLI